MRARWYRDGTTSGLELEIAVAEICGELELARGELARAFRADRIDARVSLRRGLTGGGTFADEVAPVVERACACLARGWLLAYLAKASSAAGNLQES